MPRAFVVAILVVRVLSAQGESSALLDRAREKILDSLRRLPKYTCLETIDRAYYAAPRARLNRKLMTETPATACDGDAPSRVSLDAKDRLRVEVVVVNQRELLSWPGASRFDTSLIDQMIPLGPISTGSFGIYLLDVFANPKVQFTFTGRRTDGKRDVFEYSYTVPVDASHMKIKGSSEWRAAGYSGSFEINTGTAELATLVIKSDALPPDTGMCYTKTALDYHFTLIGDGEFLIPLRSELETFDIDGRRTDSVTGFSACHEFTAESSLRFDEQTTPAISAVKTSSIGTALPPGLSLTLGLIGSIDTRTAAAGDPVSAKVESAVKAPGSNEILVPAGTIAHGRIVQMRHQYSTSQFLISIRFDTVEIKGVLSPLSVRLDRELRGEQRIQGGFRTRGTEFSLPEPLSSQQGSVLAVSANRGEAVIPVGFRSKWKTVRHE